MKHRLVEERTRQGVVDDYKSGKRILDIEEHYGIPRATLYWILDQEGVLPERSKRGERFKGTTEDLTQLFQLVQAQEAYVQQLEELLRECIGKVPEDLAERVNLALTDAE